MKNKRISLIIALAVVFGVASAFATTSDFNGFIAGWYPVNGNGEPIGEDPLEENPDTPPEVFENCPTELPTICVQYFDGEGVPDPKRIIIHGPYEETP